MKKENKISELAIDAINHIKDIWLPLTDCQTCFSAHVYAFSFIMCAQEKIFVNNEFKDRTKHLVDGLFLFLQQKYTSAIYVILPQLDGIIKDHLLSSGIIYETRSYPKGTELASKPNMQYKNIKALLKEGIKNQHSKIGKTPQVVKYEEKHLEKIRKLRNATLHGSKAELKKHDAVDVIHLLIALYHDLELFEITIPHHNTVHSIKNGKA
mgnify:CR=1 FL=1